jgi:hypothetical protein
MKLNRIMTAPCLRMAAARKHLWLMWQGKTGIHVALTRPLRVRITLSWPGLHIAILGVRPHFVNGGSGRHGSRLEIVEDEKADRGGQIALLAITVDLTHQLRQGQVPDSGDFLHPVPECLFQADAGLVTGDDD